MSNYAEIAGVRFASEAGAWLTFSLEHERVHMGQVFHAGTINSALGNGATALLTLKAGTLQPHMMWTLAAGGNSTLRILENGAVAGSAAVTAYNRNRGNSGTPHATVVSGGTLTGGTVLTEEYIPGGSGGIRPGGAARAEVEWVGEESWTYVFEVVNVSGQAAGMSLSIDWYELSEH
jgi:hypothetical protein